VTQSDDQSGEKQTPDKTGSGLDDLRGRIDAVDSQLIRLLNERAKVVQEIGERKRASGEPIYAPHREAQVLDKVVGKSEGPLPDRTIEAVYKELMSGSFALEQPLRIGYLGPPGSFSHLAAVRQFGSSVEYDDLGLIEHVFHEVRRGHINHGLVPIENSVFGGITETLDALRDAGAEVGVYAEVQLEVHHTLLSPCEAPSITTIYSKPEVFAQCRRWIAAQYPRAELVSTASSSRAVKTVAQRFAADGAQGEAAIASSLAGKIYDLPILFDRIEDNPNNITRFFVISREKAQVSGDDKTSIMFATADKPGALVEVLSVFERAGVNLTHIEKRPSGRTNWTYTFFIDALGHREDPALRSAVEEAARHCRELVVLGSYPRSTRFL
jgi:chorismate mutase / prephenate dehydratase